MSSQMRMLDLSRAGGYLMRPKIITDATLSTFLNMMENSPCSVCACCAYLLTLFNSGSMMLSRYRTWHAVVSHGNADLNLCRLCFFVNWYMCDSCHHSSTDDMSNAPNKALISHSNYEICYHIFPACQRLKHTQETLMNNELMEWFTLQKKYFFDLFPTKISNSYIKKLFYYI